MTGRDPAVEVRACEECSKPAIARGLCGSHYMKASRRGNLPPLAPRKEWTWQTLADRSEWDGDCLRWRGPLNDQGYGRVNWAGGSRVMVHRVAYELMVGAIPPGMQVDHVVKLGCRFRDCVNPAHLEAVTPVENVRRQPRRATDTCPAGHRYTLRNDGSGWRECKPCRSIRQAEKVTCECGAVVSRNNLRLHQSRATHTEAMGAISHEQ